MAVDEFVQKVTSKGEQYSESVYEKTKFILPFIARLCLVSHFIQDNAIMIHHSEKILKHWGQPGAHAFRHNMAVIAYAVCFLSRSIGIILAVFRKKVPWTCGILLGSDILELILTIHRFPNISSILLNASVFGCLFFLLAEGQGDTNSSFAGVPTLDEKKPQDYMKLCGRCLLVLMFLNFISLEASFLLILQDLLGFSLMILVVLGYKTKLSVLVTILYLNVFNIYENEWWTIDDNQCERMAMLHTFLKGISVTGGLLMLVLHGPGELSLDKAKKNW